MAVYTVLDRDEVESLIKPFGIGPLIDFEGVTAGIENSNYFVTTDHSGLPSETRTKSTGEYVLTIFESAAAEELLFFNQLTTLLNLKGLPVPCPLRNADGTSIQHIHGKPAIVVPKVAGTHPKQATPQQCQALGNTLAHIHLSCQQAQLQHTSTRSIAWLAQLANALLPQLSTEDAKLASEVSRFQQLTERHPNLPQAVIHGDLFRDNALVLNDEISGIIDFNNAGDGHLMLDLAIVVNDWCSRPDGSLDPALVSAILAHYQQVRPFTSDETLLWNDFLRVAACRFWLSRLASSLKTETQQRPGVLVEEKDPDEYRQILLHHIQAPQKLKE